MSAQDEILHKCLNEMEVENLSLEECLRRYVDHAEKLRPLLETADRYRRAPVIRPSAAFREGARARMLHLATAAPRASTRTERGSPWTSWWRRTTLTGAVARASAVLLVFFIVIGGSAMAASAAAPDSLLYPAKLALEEARLTLAHRAAERFELRLSMAERRARELLEMHGQEAPDVFQRVKTQYELALRLAAREAAASDTPQAAFLMLEARLASQEKAIQEVLARREGTSPEYRASLGQALGIVERLRAELRLRAGDEDPAPSSTTPGGPAAPLEPEQPDPRQYLRPAVVETPTSTPPTPTPCPTPTHAAGGPGARQESPTPTDMTPRFGRQSTPPAIGAPGTSVSTPSPTTTPGGYGQAGPSATSGAGQYGWGATPTTTPVPTEEPTPAPTKAPEETAQPQPTAERGPQPDDLAPSATPQGSRVTPSVPHTSGSPGDPGGTR